MSNAALNPYQPPLHPAKLAAGEAADVQHRDVRTFVFLMIITLGIYWFYVAYQWAKELNGLVGRVKFQPLVVLLTSVATCGVAGVVFECLYAFDIAEQTQARGLKGRLEALPTWIAATNCAAVILSLIPLGVVIGLPLGILASVLMQVELNKLARRYVA